MPFCTQSGARYGRLLVGPADCVLVTARAGIRLNASMRTGALEITDLLWPVDSAGKRLPVVKDQAVALLSSRGQSRAARLVARMPVRDGLIDPDRLDRLGLRIHCELQRLGEELQVDRRVAALLDAPIRRLLATSSDPVAIVDVGCGLGHVVRAAAARDLFPAEVQLVGVDLNPLLIDEARRLATLEGLHCHFIAGDAFNPALTMADPRRTIIISTGLLHHFSEKECGFQQECPAT